jgi:hypothetical protein
MKFYEVKHRCGCKLTVIDETYQGGNYPYCKKCKTNVKLTKPNIRNSEFKFIELRVPVPVPITDSYFECQSQSQLVDT